MNNEKFITMVKKLADNNVQNKLKIMINEIGKSLQRVSGCYCSDINDSPNKEILDLLVLPYADRKWPEQLWEEEEKKITKELFSTMDIMQQALVAKEPDKNDPNYFHKKEGGD